MRMRKNRWNSFGTTTRMMTMPWNDNLMLFSAMEMKTMETGISNLIRNAFVVCFFVRRSGEKRGRRAMRCWTRPSGGQMGYIDSGEQARTAHLEH